MKTWNKQIKKPLRKEFLRLVKTVMAGNSLVYFVTHNTFQCKTVVTETYSIYQYHFSIHIILWPSLKEKYVIPYYPSYSHESGTIN